MTIEIRSETAVDRQAIQLLNRAAFETDAEAKLVDALRDGGFVDISLVAEEVGSIIGHILFSQLPIVTTAGTVITVSLAPMAVQPSHQRQGVGSRLVEAGLEACRVQEHRIAVVRGHPEFYPRFGFVAHIALPLAAP